LAAKYLNTMSPVIPTDLLVDARAVPEPQMMQGEDDVPVLVSTSDDKETQKDKISAEPSARPIRDVEDLKSTDFDGVLGNTTGDSE